MVNINCEYIYMEQWFERSENVPRESQAHDLKMVFAENVQNEFAGKRANMSNDCCINKASNEQKAPYLQGGGRPSACGRCGVEGESKGDGAKGD